MMVRYCSACERQHVGNESRISICCDAPLLTGDEALERRVGLGIPQDEDGSKPFYPPWPSTEDDIHRVRIAE